MPQLDQRRVLRLWTSGLTPEEIASTVGADPQLVSAFLGSCAKAAAGPQTRTEKLRSWLSEHWLAFAIFGSLVLIPGMIVLHANSDGRAELLGRLFGYATTEVQRDTLISYLAQPDFAGDSFVTQYFGPGHSTAWVDPENRKLVLVTDDTAASTAKLDSLTPANRASATIIPFDELHVDSQKKWLFPFRHAVYSVTLSDLARLSHGWKRYGGHLHVVAAENNLRRTVFVNFGSRVALPGEESLQRLAQALTSSIPADAADAREQRVQALLDLVSTEIRYDDSVEWTEVQVIKNPNEVLMTREADCTGKAVLMASLLEQIGEDYRLIYYEHHLAVLVERGHFSLRDEKYPHRYHWQGKEWLLAETTSPGFRVGQSVLVDDTGSVLYIQRPQEIDRIISLRSMLPATVTD